MLTRRRDEELGLAVVDLARAPRDCRKFCNFRYPKLETGRCPSPAGKCIAGKCIAGLGIRVRYRMRAIPAGLKNAAVRPNGRQVTR